MSNVSSSNVASSGSQIVAIASSLQDQYDQMTKDLTQLTSAISTLKGWNGSDASEIFTEEQNPIEGLFMPPKQYKYIWNIAVSNTDIVSTAASSSSYQSINESISHLNVAGTDLETLSATLDSFISQIEMVLGVSYTGNLKQFFDSLKGNATWEEMKTVASSAKEKKEHDELYQRFISKKGEPDVADYALEELGNTFLATTLSTKYALWYMQTHPGQGASPSDNWCAEYVSYVMEKSGNANKYSPYLNVTTGANEAQARAKEGSGQWHDSSSDYQPKRGDIYYTYKGGREHTGIVLSSTEDKVYTVEGNTVNDDGTYTKTPQSGVGGYVNTRIRDKSYIQGGYYTPDTYLNPSGLEQSKTPSLPQDDIVNKIEIDTRYQATGGAGAGAQNGQ